MIIFWRWRCAGCKTEVETDAGKLPAECACAGREWMKISERKEKEKGK